MNWTGKRVGGERVTSVEMDGLDTKDYPDFCDAFIANAVLETRDATDAELDELNNDAEYVHQCALEYFQ
jgi:hypothetical protein